MGGRSARSSGFLFATARWALLSFIVAGLFFMALEVVVWVHPAALAFGLSLIHRTPACTGLAAYRGLERRQRQYYATREVERSRRLLETDTTGYHLWQTSRGRWWVPSGSDHVLPILLAQQQARIYGDGRQRVRRGEIVLDCGAHVGVYTREALDAGAKLVVAIEPAPANLECLRRNLRPEIAAGRVIVCPKGVWDKEDRLPLYEDPGNSAADSFVVRGARGKLGQVIPLTTIDRIVEELGLGRVDAIKMDIKGATERALLGARRTLLRHRPRLALSTEESADNPGRLRAALAGMRLGYRSACIACSLDSNLLLTPDVLLFEAAESRPAEPRTSAHSGQTMAR